jgi:hypothetical protein
MKDKTRRRRLTPILLATQEAEIRRITVQRQPRAGGVAQGVGPEFKSQYHEKQKKERKKMKHIQVLIAQACNPSNSGSRDQEDHSSKAAQANSS